MKTTLPRVIADRGREGAGDVKLVAFEKCWESGRVREATWVWEGEGERERERGLNAKVWTPAGKETLL